MTTNRPLEGMKTYPIGKSYDWNPRTAYAACPTDSATSVLNQATAADRSADEKLEM
jgi:hypothetical protein